jgi:hypothetical protein
MCLLLLLRRFAILEALRSPDPIFKQALQVRK